MKNRRLNVLFVAIIALAAAPQALEDARHFATSAQERAEAGFWDTFLSSRTRGVEAKSPNTEPELIAAVQPVEGGNCPFESEVATAPPVFRNASRSAGSGTSARRERETSLVTENLKRDSSLDEENFDFEVTDEGAASHPVQLSEQKAFSIAGLHALNAAQVTEALTKAALASSLAQKDEQVQMRLRRMMETDKLMRPKVRYMLDKGDAKTEVRALPRVEGI